MSDSPAAPLTVGPNPQQSDSRIGYADRPGLTGLIVRNFFLTLVSLGFYRFWARARLRRYFWSNILVASEPLEYTGTGLELFIGFLIAIAIVGPFGIAYVILQRVMLGNPIAEAILNVCYIVALFLFVQIVVFRARRYRLSRTAWRGIYAAQTGSAWRYLALSVLYSLLTLVTLGLAVPWRSVALERYKIEHSWFGESRFSLDAKASDLFLRWLLVMALLAIPVLAFIAINRTVFPELAHLPAQANQAAIAMPHFSAKWLLFFSGLVGGPALVWYWVASFRYITSHTRLGEIRLLSAAQGSSVLKTILLFALGVVGVSVGFVLVFFTLGQMFAMTAFALIGGKAATGTSMVSAIVVAMAFLLPMYLGIAVVFQIISYWWLRVPILRHLATTIEVENLSAIAKILQSAKPRQRFGVADSFDIGAI